MANKIFLFNIQKIRQTGRSKSHTVLEDTLQVPADTLHQAMFRLGAHYQKYTIFSTLEKAIAAATCWKWPVDAIVVTYQGEVL